MVRGATVFQEVTVLPIPVELESGTYTYICHGTKSEFKDIESLKAEIKGRWELEEGLTVLGIKIVQVVGGEEPSTENLLWSEGDLTKIPEDHTDLIVKFRIDSPFPWAVVILLIMFVSGLIVGFLISGAFEKILEVVYKEPVLVGLGLVALLVFGLVALGVKVPERKREE